MKKVFYSLSAALVSLSLSGQGDSTKGVTDAHRSNFRHLSLGLNVGNTLALGTGASYFWGNPDVDAPSGIGGFEFGFRGNLTYFVNPSFGFMGSAGYHLTSGTAPNAYFRGNNLDADVSAVVNLSNWLLRGHSSERKSAFLFTAGIGITSIWAEAFVDDRRRVINGPSGPFNPENRAEQAIVPLQVIYKYKINNRWDFDATYRHVLLFEDYTDGIVRYVGGNNRDIQGYLAVGLSYNFGKKDDGKSSIVYSNPLDDIYGEMQDIREKFDLLTTDSDDDGVPDLRDQDNETPEGVVVGPKGIALDVDEDGIPDYLDVDPFTPKGVQVDSEGRPVDSDGDGVPDYMDKEANTPKGAMVNFQGVQIPTGGSGSLMPSIYFAFNSSQVTAANHQRLADVARAIKNSPNAKVQLIGYADKVGPESYNLKLSDSRAKAVAKQLIQVYGIDESRIQTTGKGNQEFLAEGRNDVNRRVDVIIK